MFRPRVVLLVFCCSLLFLAGCGGIVQTDGAAVHTTSTTTPGWNSTLEVHYINVGQSVSTLVVSPTGETMLVDTGHYNDDGEYVLQYLQSHNVTRIDQLVVSHNDADHIGGNAAIIDYYETEADGIGAIYDPGIAASTQTYTEYLDAVEEHDVTLYETREGDSIQFDGVDVQVLGPPEPYLESEARNENSLVLRLGYNETSFLLTGDAEDDQEAYLVETYGQQLDATVLKAGHHGSSSSTSGALLDAVDPGAVVISSAYDSQYDHPTAAVLDRFATRSIPAYWTALHGDIVLVSNGTTVSVQTQQAAPTDPTVLRDGDPIEPGTGGAVTERERLTGAAAVSPAPVATDGGGGNLVIEEIHADAAGDDRENLNDEYVVFGNDGDTDLDLTGWTVADEVDKTYEFPDGYTLAAGDSVTLYTGAGTDTDDELYWDYGSPVWNNAGDTVTVRNSEGDIVREETY
ncbi:MULTISPECIES: lamin tail domain-containing protein [Haloarcula]|uniref:lamin tail domain-containing protein n=1 Tax=Haloarcula TaxID=2237 RepID=UPI0023E759B3|nr:lamin tail domain-containing protein [Halomicroarcula sp. SHR3]